MDDEMVPGWSWISDQVHRGKRTRSAIVTGGSRGIGRAVAERLCADGAEVVVVARGEERLRGVAEQLGARAIAADVSDPAAVERLADETSEAFGGAPDVIVNAAGAFELAPLAEATAESFERQLAANLRGPFHVIRAFLPSLLGRGSGHIVTLGSVAGRRAFPHNGAYAASKFGVRGLHEVLNEELRGTGVRATLVELGATDTPAWDDIDFQRHPGLPPREAMLAPEAVADAVVYALTQPAGVDVRSVLLESD